MIVSIVEKYRLDEIWARWRGSSWTRWLTVVLNSLAYVSCDYSNHAKNNIDDLGVYSNSQHLKWN